MLKGHDLHIREASTKLAARNYGPYEIIEQPGPVNFKLKLPKTLKIHPVFHASKFIPYHNDLISDRNPPKPGPIQVDGQDEFEVEAILDSRVHRGRVQYLVKWKGYDNSENSWEPVRNVINAKGLVDMFHTQHPDAPQPISMTNSKPIDTIFHREIWFERFAEAQALRWGNVTTF